MPTELEVALTTIATEDRPVLGVLAADEAWRLTHPAAKVVDAQAFGQLESGFTSHLQARIDAAAAEVDGNARIPQVIIPGGRYSLTSTIDWKGCDIIAVASPGNGVRIQWDGVADGTAFVRDGVVPGGLSFGMMRNIYFLPGSTAPGVWLDLTEDYVDADFQLERLGFNGYTEAGIKMAGWFNCHWRNLRFDRGGGYGILATPPTQNGSSFVVDQFTYDNVTSSTSEGLMKVDATSNASNYGLVTWRDGRIELNAAWVGGQAIFTIQHGSSAFSRSVGFKLENVVFQDVIASGNAAIINRDTTNTGSAESLTIVNSRFQGLASIRRGTWTSFVVYPPDQAVTHGASVPFLHFAGQGNTPQYWDKSLTHVLTDEANIATDAARANVFRVTLAGNRTMLAPTNPVDGQQIEYRISQDATGSRTMTWTTGSGGFRFNTTFPTPTLSTAAFKLDIIRFVYNLASLRWECVGVILGA